MEVDAHARELIQLYETDIRPFLAEHRVISIDALDQAKQALEQTLKRPAHLKVGFVGASQVGKSSIINALLGQRVVPAGGIGPLTAQATTIEYRDLNAIEVKYHGGDQLNRFRLGLESYLRKRGEFDAPSDGDEAPIEQEVLFDAELARGEEPPEEQRGGTSEVGEHMLQQARLLLQRPGDPLEITARIRDLSRPALIDAVRLMLDQQPHGDVEPLEVLRDRIREVRRYLGRSESIYEEEGKNAEFSAQLRLRAAQWMSPLVERLQLHMRAPLLRDLTLVDLPGIGNIADAGGTVADEFVRGHDAGALVVVFRNNGVTRDVVDILERAGVFTRLLWGGRSGRPPIRIILVVTYLDSVAQSRYDEIVSRGEQAPDPHEIFQSVADEMTATIRSSLRLALESSAAYRNFSESLAEREERVRSIVADSVEILGVDAKDYLQIIEKQPRGRFLDDEATTNIPTLRQRLRAIAEDAARDRERAIRAAHSELRVSLQEAMQLVARLYEEGGGRATQEWERFRRDLVQAADPLRGRLNAGRERTVRKLRDELPNRLDDLCADARTNAMKELRALRKRGETLYWPSLNAAMRRGGVWKGQRLDYPGRLTRALVDTIAASWGPMVVDEVLETVRALADAEIELVDLVFEAARAIDGVLGADVPIDAQKEAQIDAQKKVLKQQARSCVRWTDERLDELRETVQAELRDVVAAPIASACQSAIARGANRGRGASRAILDTFQNAGTKAIQEATGKAKQLLERHYSALLVELDEGYLKEHHDPVTAALEALMGEELDRARDADEDARRRVLRHARELAQTLSELRPGDVA